MSGWGRTVREFAASRAARLYPAFWACVLITGRGQHDAADQRRRAVPAPAGRPGRAAST